jgi:HlyD family secretion protein
MRPTILRLQSVRGAFAAVLTLSMVVPFAAGCRKEVVPDAYGNFEATEVVVGAQATGQLQWFLPTEGSHIDAGAVVGLIDTTQLSLQRAQLIAQREVSGARVTEVVEQIRGLEAQREVARRVLDRTRRLLEQNAATAQQLDQADRDYRALVAQIDAATAHRATVGKEAVSSDATIAQIRDRIAKSGITNPHPGTVVATFVKAGEVVQPGQALYKIANLDTLTLRAYVTEGQLASVKLGQRVQVNVDQGGGKLLAVPGVVSWISSTAEFTPTPVQTRDERADLVYAVKVQVANTGGALKIGMPADVDLAVTTRQP